MNENIFTEDFYESLFDAIIEEGEKDIQGFYAEEICSGESVSIDGYVGDYFFSAKVHFTLDWHDESFDHAFGTWHDPNPYYEVDGCDHIEDVKIYESDKKDSKEIEGFDYDAFWAQFEKDSYSGFKKGMKVTYNGFDAEWLAFNSMKNEYKIRLENGNIYYVRKDFVKKKQLIKMNVFKCCGKGMVFCGYDIRETYGIPKYICCVCGRIHYDEDGIELYTNR